MSSAPSGIPTRDPTPEPTPDPAALTSPADRDQASNSNGGACPAEDSCDQGTSIRFFMSKIALSGRCQTRCVKLKKVSSFLSNGYHCGSICPEVEDTIIPPPPLLPGKTPPEATPAPTQSPVKIPVKTPVKKPEPISHDECSSDLECVADFFGSTPC